MITIERTFDVDYIRQCVTHPKLWEYLTDDGCPSPQAYIPIITDVVYWLKPAEDGNDLGVFMVHPHNYICYEVHTCLLPKIWGRSRECTVPLIEWVFKNTNCRRLITNVPNYNARALKLALNSGLVIFGTNEKSIIKNGILHDQIMLGISKEN